MKTPRTLALMLLTLLLLSQCSPKKSPNLSVVVVKRALLFQAGKQIPQGVVQIGDTVTVKLPILSENNAAEVILRDGKEGYLPLSALSIPDSAIKESTK